MPKTVEVAARELEKQRQREAAAYAAIHCPVCERRGVTVTVEMPESSGATVAWCPCGAIFMYTAGDPETTVDYLFNTNYSEVIGPVVTALHQCAWMEDWYAK